MAIINKQMPEMPTSLRNSEEDLLWLVCQKCWQIMPSHRPDMGRLCSVLKNGVVKYSHADSLSSECGGLMERLQFFTLWDNPHMEVVWEERIPHVFEDNSEVWRIIFSDITLRCIRTGRR